MSDPEAGPVQAPSTVLGQRIKELRDEHGWSLQDLADQMRAHGVKLHKTTVAKVENGERRVPLDELFTFAYVLDVAPVHLFVPPDLERSDLRMRVATDIAPGPYVLRKWIRGELPLAGQDERRFRLSSPFPSFGEHRGQRRDRLADVADEARNALAEGDVAKASSALGELAYLTQALQQELGFPEGPSITVEVDS